MGDGLGGYQQSAALCFLHGLEGVVTKGSLLLQIGAYSLEFVAR